ncbi:hypothetical protein P9112_013104 [Eukaryota sp. TZLM1-RC]
MVVEYRQQKRGESRHVTDVTVEDCINMMLKLNSHNSFECHLPSSIPFSHVRHILMPKATFDSLPPNVQQQLFEMGNLVDDFLKVIDGDETSKEYKDVMKKLSSTTVDNDNVASFQGYSFVLKALPFFTIPESIGVSEPIHIAFSVMASSNFHVLLVIEGYSTLRFAFQQGTISLYTNQNDLLCRQRLYFPSRLAQLYLRFGLSVERATGKILLQRIGKECSFKFDPLQFTLAEPITSTNPCYIGFKLDGDGYASFKNVLLKASRTMISTVSGSAAELTLNRFNSNTLASDPPLGNKRDSDDDPDSSLSSLRINPDENVDTSRVNNVEAPPTERNPLCPHPWTCSFYYDDKRARTSQGVQHQSNYRHICRFGYSCRNINDTNHTDHFIHIQREKCPQGESCREIADPVHRFNYAHGTLHLIPYKCKHGSNCRRKESPSCFRKYGHWEVDNDPSGVVMPNLQSNDRSLSGFLHRVASAIGFN